LYLINATTIHILHLQLVEKAEQ